MKNKAAALCLQTSDKLYGQPHLNDKVAAELKFSMVTL